MLRALALLGVVEVVAAGCGSAAGDRPTPPQRTHAAGRERQVARPAVPSSRAGVSVKLMQTQYGNVLVDGRGRALYLFTRDRTPVSQCYGECAGRWPPFLAAGMPVAGNGAQANLLGRTRRRDGSTQVTYRGHPLYYYIGDRLPGQVLCQNVEEFGGRWYVLTRRGSAVL
jgi:predicted lipoprotein with Yx(FWY)xxD motif